MKNFTYYLAFAVAFMLQVELAADVFAAPKDNGTSQTPMQVAVNYFNKKANLKAIKPTDKYYTEPIMPKINDKDLQMGFVNEKDKWVIKPEFGDAEKFGDDGCAFVSYQGFWGVIDRSGTFCCAPIFSSHLRTSVPGLFAFKCSRVLWEELLDKDYKSNREGVLSKVSTRDVVRVYAFADGRLLTQTELEEGYDFDTLGVAIVKTKAGFGLLKLDGTFACEPQFEQISVFSRNGLYRFRQGDRFGLVSVNGNIVLPAKYDSIGFWHRENLTWIRDAETGKWGAIAPDAKMVLEPMLDKDPQSLATYNTAVVSKDGKYGVLKGDGSFVIDCQADYILAGKDCYWMARNGHASIFYRDKSRPRLLQLPDPTEEPTSFASLIVSCRTAFFSTYNTLNWVEGFSDFTVFQPSRDKRGSYLTFDCKGGQYQLKLEYQEANDTLEIPQPAGTILSMRSLDSGDWYQLPVTKKVGVIGDESNPVELLNNEYEAGVYDFNHDGTPEIILMMRNVAADCPAQAAGVCYNMYEFNPKTGLWKQYRASRLTQDRVKGVQINGNSFKPIQ